MNNRYEFQVREKYMRPSRNFADWQHDHRCLQPTKVSSRITRVLQLKPKWLYILTVSLGYYYYMSLNAFVVRFPNRETWILFKDEFDLLIYTCDIMLISEFNLSEGNLVWIIDTARRYGYKWKKRLSTWPNLFPNEI